MSQQYFLPNSTKFHQQNERNKPNEVASNPDHPRKTPAPQKHVFGAKLHPKKRRGARRTHKCGEGA